MAISPAARLDIPKAWVVSGIMSDDPQDKAESFDEDIISGDDIITSDQSETDFPPERPHGIPFADADITDESFAERSAQEVLELSEADIDERDADDDARIDRRGE